MNLSINAEDNESTLMGLTGYNKTIDSTPTNNPNYRAIRPDSSEYPSNSPNLIRTSKYTLVSFVPLNLYNQFQKM